ncbi:MAG: hypothetical protein IPM29_09785 [Planctomycetes bacterium]|nr:hypothetical protein [Planctomycetota bacterium]
MTRRRVLLTVLALAAGVECVGNAWSFALWARQPVRPDGAPIAGRVLWVGDVDGVVPRPPSDADTVDLTAPALTLRDVLGALPVTLAEQRPQCVVLRAGAEDRRRGLSGPVTWPAGQCAGWRPHSVWAAWLAGTRRAPTPTSADPGAEPFVGEWHLGGTRVHFGADGTFELGATVGGWRRTGADGLELRPAGAAPFTVQFRRDGNRLTLAGGVPGGRFELQAGPPPSSVVERARAAIADGRQAEALHLLGPARRGALAENGADELFAAIATGARVRVGAPPEPEGPPPGTDLAALEASLVAHVDAIATIVAHYGAVLVLVLDDGDPLAAQRGGGWDELVRVGPADVGRGVREALERARGR